MGLLIQRNLITVVGIVTLFLLLTGCTITNLAASAAGEAVDLFTEDQAAPLLDLSYQSGGEKTQGLKITEDINTGDNATIETIEAEAVTEITGEVEHIETTKAETVTAVQGPVEAINHNNDCPWVWLFAFAGWILPVPLDILKWLQSQYRQRKEIRL